jgi:hypothetical protein
VDRLSELLGSAVQFTYTCWDRIVVTGYIERLQRPENLVHFFHAAVGIDCIEPAVLEQRTAAYRAWVRRITDEHRIPLVAAPKGARKEELVEPYYRRLKGARGVACVLTSMEQGRTFVSYVPSRQPPSGDANYRFIKACRKRFLVFRPRARRRLLSGTAAMPIRQSPPLSIGDTPAAGIGAEEDDERRLDRRQRFRISPDSLSGARQAERSVGSVRESLTVERVYFPRSECRRSPARW